MSSPTPSTPTDPTQLADLDALLDQLERSLGAIPERDMRRAIILGRIETLKADQLVAFMVRLLHHVRMGRSSSRKLMQELALEPVVFTDLPYDTVRQAYGLARQVDEDAIARMLLSATPPRHNAGPRRPDEQPGNEHLDLPLGVRRAAARTHDRFKLDRLLHDQDPRVIRLLLANPRVVEHDVIKIAAMRPTRPEVLAEVSRSTRWAGRYRVRKALTANPHTPSTIARRLLPTLMLQDVRHIVESGVLEPELQSEARSLLRSRRTTKAIPSLEGDADLAALVSGLEDRLGDGLVPHAVLGEDGHLPPIATTPEEDAMLTELVQVMEATIDGRPGGVTLVPVADDDPGPTCALPPRPQR